MFNNLAFKEPTQVEPLVELHSMGWLLALPTSIRLGWKCVAMTKTLSYNTTALITNVIIYSERSRGLSYKTFYSNN
jgi:hypothetical protein